MVMMAPASHLKFESVGLVTGQPVCVSLERLSDGEGQHFQWADGERLSAPFLSHVADCHRGVTLATPSGKTLSIVEHFLAATALTGLSDWCLHLESSTRELPLLDGSAREWVQAIQQAGWEKPVSPSPTFQLTGKLEASAGEVVLYALPAPRFSITYALHWDHPDLRNRHVQWTYGQDNPVWVADAQTFGWVEELPALQASGLAKGVNADNTLGLIQNGGYTRPLRHADEPLFHKALDLIGDLSLTGINPLSVGMHVYAIGAGHQSHVALARQLKALLCSR